MRLPKWMADYDNSTRELAVGNYVMFSLCMGAGLGVAGGFIFQNVFAGLAGWVCWTSFSFFWWRPNGPGRRLVDAQRLRDRE